jgi:hypothetical protein
VEHKKISPYGSWRSPITADAIVAGVIGLGQIQLDGDDIYWVEQRPAEAGRNVVVRRRAGGAIEDVTPPTYNGSTGRIRAVHQFRLRRRRTSGTPTWCSTSVATG